MRGKSGGRVELFGLRLTFPEGHGTHLGQLGMQCALMETPEQGPPPTSTSTPKSVMVVQFLKVGRHEPGCILHCMHATSWRLVSVVRLKN